MADLEGVRFGTLGFADRLRFVLITGFGTGLAPVASGTVGTLPAVIAVILATKVWSGAELAIALAAAAAALLAFGCAQSGFTARVFAGGDPGQFVLDEIVGYLVAAAIFVAAAGDPSPTAHALLFFAFRAFDVLKIAPADRLEELHGAVGIMLDDVAAGVWAGAACVGLHYLGVG